MKFDLISFEKECKIHLLNSYEFYTYLLIFLNIKQPDNLKLTNAEIELLAYLLSFDGDFIFTKKESEEAAKYLRKSVSWVHHYKVELYNKKIIKSLKHKGDKRLSFYILSDEFNKFKKIKNIEVGAIIRKKV